MWKFTLLPGVVRRSTCQCASRKSTAARRSLLRRRRRRRLGGGRLLRRRRRLERLGLLLDLFSLPLGPKIDTLLSPQVGCALVTSGRRELQKREVRFEVVPRLGDDSHR